MSEPIAPGPSDAPANGAPAVRWWWLLVGPLLALLLVAGGAAALIASGGDGDASDAHAMGSAPPLELASVTDDIAGHYRYAERPQTAFAATTSEGRRAGKKVVRPWKTWGAP